MRHELSMNVLAGNKMVLRFISPLIFSLLVVLSGCEKDKETSSAKDNGLKNVSQKEAKQTIRVTTVEEFIQAIGPNRTIELDADEFILSDVKDRYHEYVRWDLSYSNSLSILIRNVKHLTIKGRDDMPTRFLVKFANSDVLNFENCHDVALHNLALGHTTETNDCDSGVVCIQDSTNISFHHCDLFGCGTEGLSLKDVEGFLFKDSIIRDCSVGIMNITSCKNIRFEMLRFEIIKNIMELLFAIV